MYTSPIPPAGRRAMCSHLLQPQDTSRSVASNEALVGKVDLRTILNINHDGVEMESFYQHVFIIDFSLFHDRSSVLPAYQSSSGNPPTTIHSLQSQHTRRPLAVRAAARRCWRHYESHPRPCDLHRAESAGELSAKPVQTRESDGPRKPPWDHIAVCPTQFYTYHYIFNS